MFTWRRIEQDDYKMLVSWWESWGWESSPTLDMLPETGVLVYDEETGIPLYAGFLYDTRTSIGWLEFVVSNKYATTESKRGALDYLVETVHTIARFIGIRTLFTSTNNDSFVQSLKKAGFEVGDRNIVQLVKR